MLAVLAGLLTAIAAPAQAATCSGSTSGVLRGKTVQFDQCVRATVVRGGTTYTVTVYYTEQNTATNLAQCVAAENAVNRCEHALTNNDDANGDNINALAAATETASALGFYIDRGLGFPVGGATDMTVLVGEDPRGGGVINPGTLYWDDEWVDQNDPLFKRVLAYHETMHLIQDIYDDGTGWRGWFGEGIARAIEDRVDPALDADTGHLFIPELNGLMSSESDRTATATDTDYRSFLWWTWLFDQYKAASDVDPVVGWTAIKDFYTTLGASTDQLQAVRSFITSRGGSLDQDWLDYTASLWAYKRSPANARLTYLDSEIKASGNAMTGQQSITGSPVFNAAQATPTINSRSVKYYELNPATQCDYASFSYNGGANTFGYTVMTADGTGALVNRWSAMSRTWTRTVRTAGLSRIASAITGLDTTGPVTAGWGCVTPSLQISRPTTAAFEIVGLPSAPRRFVVQVKVTGPSGEAIAGLTPSSFSVGVTKPSGGAPMPATVVQGAYVQDTYWLLVQAPNAAAGAVAGGFHDLTVSLGPTSSTITDTTVDALLYADRSVDAITVLDRSGSMQDSDKIGAARNAATLLNDGLASNDQGGYVSFNEDATLDRSLAPMSAAQRAAIAAAINGAVASGATSIGDGMRTAASDHDARKDPSHACGFTLLSDGYENSPDLWATVRPQVVDNGCAIHAIALGPEANEPLMQSISASTPGGSYDYADVGGVVPVGTSGTGSGASSGSGGGGSGGSPGATETLGWGNNLSRIYDIKNTRLAGRQRLATFIGTGDDGCRTVDATVGFEGRPVGSSLAAGEAFTDNRIPVKVDGYRSAGAASFDADLTAQGAGTQAQLKDAGLVFGFKPGCQVQFRYHQLGGTAALLINGERIDSDLLLALDGRVVNGAQIRVYPDSQKRLSGQVVITGQLDEFGVYGSSLAIDEVVHRVEGKGRTFVVDDTTRQLVTTVGWQTPDASRDVVLIDPNGNQVPASARRPGSTDRNEQWVVTNPVPGTWRVIVEGLDQEFFVTETAITDVALRLVIGAPLGDATAGASVPIAAFFSGPSGAVKGAPVWATITDPKRRSTLVKLLDDGAHHDGEAADGVYGGSYAATGDGDLGSFEAPREGESTPAVAGSYTVTAVGFSGSDRREDSASFAITRSTDLDQDGISDDWEKRNGMDPSNVKDGQSDPDRDGLVQVCEYQLGTDPAADDSDGGGETDGSEARWDGSRCQATTNPANPTDDRVGTLGAVGTEAEALNRVPKVVVSWAAPTKGTLSSVTVQRRVLGTVSWGTIAAGRTGDSFTDTTVVAGTTYQYRLLPVVQDSAGVGHKARALVSQPVKALADPYAPYGSVVINNGAATTARTAVTLSLIAEDVEGSEGDVPVAGPRVLGTPTASLRMRVSNRADFRGATWRTFARSLAWTLPTTPGQATVFVEFKDAAGNVSSSEGVSTDTIRFQPRG